MGMERRLSSCSIKADRASEAVQPAEQGWHRVMLGSDTLQWHNQSFRGRAASRDPAVRLAATVGERAKNLFPLQKSTPAYRILHRTLLKHRDMMISIS